MPSSRALFSSLLIVSFKAGQDFASLSETEEGRPGCLERMWWWSVEALVTGHLRPGADTVWISRVFLQNKRL